MVVYYLMASYQVEWLYKWSDRSMIQTLACQDILDIYLSSVAPSIFLEGDRE